MTENQDYICETCGATASAAAEDKAPECCGKPMKVEPLPVCEMSPTAEHARPDDFGEPCDDGRGGS